MTASSRNTAAASQHSSIAAYSLAPFDEWLRSWGAADRTIVDRTIVIAAGLREWGDPECVTTESLARWMAAPGRSQWTRVTYCYHLKSFFGWLHESGRIPIDPTAGLRVPKAPKDKPRPLSMAEVKTVLSGASGSLRAWLLVALLSGLRAHEIAKLRGQDIDEEQIFVLGKGRQEAIIPTHPQLWDLAQEYPRGGWWFPAKTSRSSTGHVASQSISTMVTKHFSDLGIEGSIHRCRHTYATQLLRNGANIRVVQTLLRHESLATTAKYTAVNEDELASAVHALDLGEAS